MSPEMITVEYIQNRRSLYAEYAVCVGPPKHQGVTIRADPPYTQSVQAA